MAYQKISAPAQVLNREITLTRDFVAKVGTFFNAISRFFSSANAWMMENSSGNARLKIVQRLQAKSDEELAAMNLRREDIVAHVFRDLFYI